MSAMKHSRILACFELALFTFIFLDGEFVFDTVMGCLVNAHDVVAAESMVLAASAIGFLMLPLVQRLARGAISQAHATGALVVLSIAAVATYAPIAWAPATAGFGTPLFANASATLALGCAAFALLGIMGAGAHLHAARAFAGSAHTARAVGLSYAAGLLIQFAFNSLLENACAEAAALCLALCALAACMGVSTQAQAAEADIGKADVREGKGEEEGLAGEKIPVGWQNPSSASQPAPGVRRTESSRERLLLLATVALMACVFCTLNNAITLAHAQGAISVEAPPRLLLAASGILAGFVFDARRRKHMPLTMLCVTMFSVLSLLAMLAGFSNLVGLSVFYLASGFFAVFFTTSFLDTAAESPRPALWAGMGRATNNLCAGIIALPSLYLVQSGNVMATATLACALFVAITVAVYNLIAPRMLADTQVSATQTQKGWGPKSPTAAVAGATSAEGDAREDSPYAQERIAPALRKREQTAPASTDAEKGETASPEQPLARFCERYRLTPREADVLERVCSDERTLRELSEEMGISQRMLQRHLTSIYRKTGVQTRAGLISMLLKEN